MKRLILIAAPLLVAAVLALVLVVLPASRPPAEQPAVERKPRYNESPMLRERVERGELPPVEQRLPDNPLVVEPPSVGRYSTEP